jgi:very-short-patch-repair endonuclease
VYVYGGGKLTIEGELLAAVWAIGDDTALTFCGAATLRGFWKGGWKPVDVTVPRRVSSRPGINVHFDELPPESVMTFLGIPVTTPARTALDIAGTGMDQQSFRRLVHEGEAQGLITPELILAEVDRTPWHPGAERLLAEVADGPKPTKSGKEDNLLDMLRRHGAPRFVMNAHVPGTPMWVTADVIFIDYRLVIEYDGGPWHDTRFRQEFDAHKRGLIKDVGFGVLVLTDGTVEPASEAETMAMIWRELERATPAPRH